MMGLFGDLDDTIYQDKDVLKEDYQPDEILEREAEIEEYKHALSDAVFGRTPDNVFLFGKAGVGKTAVTNYVLTELQAEVDQRDTADDVHISRVNCNNESVYSIVRTLTNNLIPPSGDRFPAKGPSKADAFERLYREMERVGGTHFFVFDEIDHLSDPDSLLYEFPRARANSYLEDARVGIIGISNNYTFRNTLSSKVKSTLMEQEISFSTYDATELSTILEHRAERAFVDGACDPSAIQACAAFAAKDDGSARQAIDLLLGAGDNAEKNGDGLVTADHVEAIHESVSRGQLKDKIADQTMHCQLVLEALALHQRDTGDTARTKQVMNRYQSVARDHNVDPLTTLESIRGHLDDLNMLGFLLRTEENRGQGGGRSYRWEVDMDIETVIDVRESIDSTPT
ncbi:orc1/cdc6 family replication initiation protein [Halarchaeum nitratireducens]|uniref:orc1/cdc6 family replication initiation protein n=1 Tax=Halarchaeum nitratireducens TaxID=489913 RepID=UPI001B3A9A3B